LTDWNQNADRATLFKGYFQIYDGATPYRFKQLVDVVVVSSVRSEEHYSDDGTKYKDGNGKSSSFSFTIDKTADLYDAVSPATDTKTISYFIEQHNNNIVPEARFEGINVTEAGSNPTVTYDFQAFVEDIEDLRTPSNGVYKVRVSGDIKDFNSSQRT